MAYGVNIVQQPPCGLLNLRGAGLVCRRYDQVLGFELPHAPNTTTGNEDITAMWLGPDEWLVKTEDGKEVSLAVALTQVYRPSKNSVSYHIVMTDEIGVWHYKCRPDAGLHERLVDASG